jgi:signal peptidase I
MPAFRSVQRGDVIVFDWPGMRDQDEKPRQTWYLKRCIGLPGDTVEIRQRIVYVNGQALPLPPGGKYLRQSPLPENYHDPHIFPRGADFNQDNYGPILVPQKGMKVSLNPYNLAAWQTFLRREGHRAAMQDGKITLDGLENNEYFVERDYVFAMGDNRDNSLDSRFWGFVPVEDIIGTPMIVYWSWDPQIPFSRLLDKISSINPSRIGTIIH